MGEYVAGAWAGRNSGCFIGTEGAPAQDASARSRRHGEREASEREGGSQAGRTRDDQMRGGCALTLKRLE